MSDTVLVYITVDCGSIRHKQAARRETIFRDTDVSARWGPCHSRYRCGPWGGGQVAGGNGFVGGRARANKLIISAPFVPFQQHNVGSPVREHDCSLQVTSTIVSTNILMVIVLTYGSVINCEGEFYLDRAVWL